MLPGISLTLKCVNLSVEPTNHNEIVYLLGFVFLLIGRMFIATLSNRLLQHLADILPSFSSERNDTGTL